jgi:hypothetical protein
MYVHQDNEERYDIFFYLSHKNLVSREHPHRLDGNFPIGPSHRGGGDKI